MPVDVTTGVVRDVATDFQIDGGRGLVWNRFYASNRARKHRHLFDWTLHADVDGIRVETPRETLFFGHLWADGSEQTRHGWTLRRVAAREYELARRGEPTRSFVSDPSGPRVFVMCRLEHADGGLTVLLHRGSELVSVQDSEGWRLRLKWSDGLLRAIVAEGSFGSFTAIAYAYDEDGLLVSGRDAYGHTFRWAYDDEGRVVRRTDRRGYAFVYRYDGVGRCTFAGGEDGVDAVSFEYAPSGRETKVVHDSNDATWWYRYGSDGALLEIEDPYGATRQFQYGPDGQKLREFDGEGHAWTFEHDDSGTQVAVRDPLDFFHPPQTDPAALDEHPLGHEPMPTPLKQELGHSGLHGRGVPMATTIAQVLSSSVAAALIPAEYAGVKTEVKDPQGLHLQVVRSFPGNTYTQTRRYAYDPNGNVRKLIDLDGSVWAHEYASWNHRVRTRDPLGGAITRTFGGRDKLASVTDPGGTKTEYAWDLCDRLHEVHRHGKLRERYLYDNAGALIEKQGPHDRTLVTYERGPMGVLLGRKTWDGVEESFERDANGRILSARSQVRDGSSCTVQRAYALGGRCTLETRDGTGFEHRYRGRRRSQTTFGAFKTTYERDGLGWVRVVDPTGREHQVQRVASGVYERRFSNGTVEVSQHDAEGQCLAKVSHGATGIWRRRFLRSGEGDLLRRDDDRRGRREYRYDAAHRLTEVVLPTGASERYEHDAAGNVLRKPGLREWAPLVAGPPDLRHDANVAMGPGNRLRRANGDAFEYDIRDHVQRRGDTVYVHDALGRLRQVRAAGQLRWEADYDALGRRTCKRVHGAEGDVDTWTFNWDGDRLGAEVLPDGRLRIYVYADDAALVPIVAVEYADAHAAPDAGRVFVLQADHRGAIERVEDESGQVVWEAIIAPYGEPEVLVGEDFHQPFRLVGQYADPEVGLAYQRFRYWSPELGRFLQSDPQGLGGGLNVYAWPGCPLSTSDPLGLGCPKKKKKKKKKDEEGTEVEELETGDVSSYGDHLRREVSGDGLEHDHIPAYSVVRDKVNEQLKKKKKPPLTPEQEGQLKKNLTSLEMPEEVHADSRTYKNRGGKERKHKDMEDLRNAAKKDLKMARENLIEDGNDPDDVKRWSDKVHRRNNKIGVYDDPLPSNLWEEDMTRQ